MNKIHFVIVGYYFTYPPLLPTICAFPLHFLCKLQFCYQCSILLSNQKHQSLFTWPQGGDETVVNADVCVSMVVNSGQIILAIDSHRCSSEVMCLTY